MTNSLISHIQAIRNAADTGDTGGVLTAVAAAGNDEHIPGSAPHNLRRYVAEILGKPMTDPIGMKRVGDSIMELAKSVVMLLQSLVGVPSGSDTEKATASQD
jgi:hypothetical protein